MATGMGDTRTRGAGRLGRAAGLGLVVGVAAALIVYFVGLHGRSGSPIMRNVPVALAAGLFIGGSTAWGVYKIGLSFFTDPDR